MRKEKLQSRKYKPIFLGASTLSAMFILGCAPVQPRNEILYIFPETKSQTDDGTLPRRNVPAFFHQFSFNDDTWEKKDFCVKIEAWDVRELDDGEKIRVPVQHPWTKSICSENLDALIFSLKDYLRTVGKNDLDLAAVLYQNRFSERTEEKTLYDNLINSKIFSIIHKDYRLER